MTMSPKALRLPVFLGLTLCCICTPVVHGITYTMDEEATIGSYIGNVSADSGLKDVVGEDDFANLRYSILSGGSQLNSQLFNISPTAGVLTVASRIDREQLCPYAETCELTIEIAARYESLLRKFNVEIIILDINDNSPKFPQDSAQVFRISESTSVDFPLSLDAATDLDGSKNFSVQNYSLTPEGVPFRVGYENNQLSLVVSRQLDREKRSVYNLTVWVYDGGSPPKSGSVSVDVIVLDVNDNAPKFTKDVYTKNISESTPPGTPVLTVLATDDDEGDNGKVVYSISSNQPEKEREKFTIGSTSGVVSVAQTLKAGVHRVFVEAQDQGTPPKAPTQATIEVTVLDTDNSPPVLSFDMLSVSDFKPGFVPESAKLSTAVGFLAVSDPDSGANALVTCNSQSEHFELQSLNLNEYKVIISKTLDRENTSHINVALVCFDGGSPKLTSTATFDVWVVDVNDSPPVFLEKHYNASVAENNGPSDGLVQVAATDRDAGNNANITYRLVNDDGKFQVGETSGMIKANGLFDYEDKVQYTFNVLAVDQGEPPLTATATVTINVLDINDEVPQFFAPDYTMRVPEMKDAGTYVGNVSVSDPDTGPGGEVILSIVPQPGLVLPFVLSENGVITTKSTLDREYRAVYTFFILAKDKGIQPLSASVPVTVEILDINDNAPSFVFTENNSTEQIFIPVDAQFVVANVRAIDSDAGSNGVVTYSVVGGNASNFFRIESNTGAVVTLIDLDQPQIGWYHLVVRATDQGLAPLHTDYNLTLQVMKRMAPQGQVMGDDEGENYVIIVICIVAFTVVVSAGVLVTLCVLRKLDQDKKLKYTAACCPDGDASPELRVGAGSHNAAADYHQQVPAVSSGVDTKTHTTGGSLSESGYGGHAHRSDGGTRTSSTRDMLGFPNHRPTGFRITDLPLSNEGKQTPQQLDVARRAEDFHSTSSAETTTGDSGHGSDEDIANHSHDRPLSPANRLSPPHLNNQPPPRPLRLGGGTVSPFAKTGSSSTPSTSSSATSPRPLFVHGGQFRGSKPQSNNVRFAPDVTNFEGRGRFLSNDSIRDDESDLNTTTSGSFSVPPDDLYADHRQLDLGYGTGDSTARYHNSSGGGVYHRDMLV